MNPDLAQLYQEGILDHYRRPRNFHPGGAASRHAEGYNPLCGDRVTVWVEVEEGRLRDVSFEGEGCAISTASASLMTEALRGLTVPEAEALFSAFHAMVTEGSERAAEIAPTLAKLAALEGVAQYPVRVKCATLAWHTLRAALAGADSAVSTE